MSFIPSVHSEAEEREETPLSFRVNDHLVIMRKQPKPVPWRELRGFAKFRKEVRAFFFGHHVPSHIQDQSNQVIDANNQLDDVDWREEMTNASEAGKIHLALSRRGEYQACLV